MIDVSSVTSIFIKFNKKTDFGTVFPIHKVIKTTDMKKVIQYFMVATIFVACKSKSDLDTNKDVILTDTTGMYKSNMRTDTGSVIETSTVTPGTQNRTAVANRRTTNTYRAPAPRTRTRTYSNNTRNRNTGSNTSNTSNNGGYSNQTTTAPAPQRRGMSSAAKGAIIGGVGGAVVGGVVKGGKGAVIGGVAGAAGGYIIGRKRDKRTGRVQ